MTQQTIAAVYMRGGTSKGVFFREDALPPPGADRDRVLLRVLGSPDPYGKQIDGMGAATSSTSKVIVVGPSTRDGYDIEYRFGQVAIDAPLIDWSGNCGNLSAAVAPYAIHAGLLPGVQDERVHVRMWQADIRKRVDAYVPMREGSVVEDGDYLLDGVAFPAAEIRLEFWDPAGSSEAPLLPTGRPVDRLEVSGFGSIEATLIMAGNPTVIVEARSVGLRGDELQAEINERADLLARCERLRAYGAFVMGLTKTPDEATLSRPATPKLAFIAAPSPYVASSGKRVEARDIDINVRILSMGRLHHALTGTGAITFAVAAALPDTLVRRLAVAGGWTDFPLRIGHPSGSVNVTAETRRVDGQWVVSKAVVSRSARRLMTGQVHVPAHMAESA